MEAGPEFLLDWHEPDESSRHVRAAIGTVIVHILVFGILSLLAKLDGPKPIEEREVARVVTPLIAPRFRLTQKEPNQGKVAKEVRVEDLLPKPEVQKRIPTPAIAPKKAFQAPPSNPLPAAPKPAPMLPPPEPPKYEAAAKPPQAMMPSVAPVPPPQIQPEEKPKLAFETPGQGGSNTSPSGAPMKVLMPKSSVDDAIRSVARGGGGSGGGVSVSDMDQLPSLPDSLRTKPVPGRMKSQVQLLSDPMGVDFKPYLIRVLASVKRNWFAVYPESARLGLRGTTALKFWVDRTGQVPHLEIAMPSGATALDRAAVASISASVPLPPLPNEYKGKQIVLQFSFQYN